MLIVACNLMKPEKAIIDTWAQLCDRIVFVVDNSTSAPPRLFIPTTTKKGQLSEWAKQDIARNKTLHLWEEAPDTYRGYEFLKLAVTTPQSEEWRNIWEKSWKMWQYVGTHHLEDAEWFLKIDDDTFFSPINFKGFARYFNPNRKWYLGSTLMHKWKQRNVVFNAGACYALSRGALEAVIPIFKTEPFLLRKAPKYAKWLCLQRDGPYEDHTMGVCLHSIGIDPVNTLDREYRERFSLFKESAHYDLKRETEPNMWYWKEKPLELKEGEECCSDKMIAFHGYKHQEAVDSFKYLHEKYNIEEGVDGKVFEIPHPPQPFLHGPLNFTVDEWRNAMTSKANDQLTYFGPGKERMCWKCNETSVLIKEPS